MSERDQSVESSKVLVNAYFRLPKETFELFTQSADTYVKLFEAWRDSLGAISSGKPESQELYNIWAKDFRGMYDDLFEMLFRPLKLLAGVQWGENLTRMGDFAKLSWPFGAFGSIYSLFKPYENLVYLYPKETPQLLQKVVDSYVNFYDAWRDYYTGLGQAWNEATQKLSTQFAEKVATSQQDPKKPLDFGTFYDTWQETFSKTYIELLSRPNMISVQSRLSTSTMDVVKYWREMWEAILSTSPISPFPTKSEMDEAYKRLHLLKRNIEDINQQVEIQPTRSQIEEVNKTLLALKKQVEGIGHKVEMQATKTELDKTREWLLLLQKKIDEISQKVEIQWHVSEPTHKEKQPG